MRMYQESSGRWAAPRSLGRGERNSVASHTTPPMCPASPGAEVPVGSQKPWLSGDAVKRAGGGGASQGYGVENNSRERKTASGLSRRVAVQRKKRERLI